MTTINVPYNQIVDGHKLDQDGFVSLFEILPLSGGAIHIKNGPEYEYLGILYEELPVQLVGEKWAADGSTRTPRLVVAQPDWDRLPFKGLINDGFLEGARITRHQVLLEDMLNNIDSKRTTYYKIKRVENYTRTNISLLLSSYSGAVRQTYPFRQYVPPSFPWVVLG